MCQRVIIGKSLPIDFGIHLEGLRVHDVGQLRLMHVTFRAFEALLLVVLLIVGQSATGTLRPILHSSLAYII